MTHDLESFLSGAISSPCNDINFSLEQFRLGLVGFGVPVMTAETLAGLLADYIGATFEIQRTLPRLATEVERLGEALTDGEPLVASWTCTLAGAVAQLATRREAASDAFNRLASVVVEMASR